VSSSSSLPQLKALGESALSSSRANTRACGLMTRRSVENETWNCGQKRILEGE
jgi:hypothetical protein